MNKGLLIVGALLLALAMAAAQEQVSFHELGYEGIEADGIEARECAEFVFSVPDPGAEYTPILSIRAEFFPQKEGEVSVSLELNGSILAEFKTADFRCKAGKCWARAEIDRGKLQEENALDVCVRTGKSITRVSLSSESLFGYYKVPAFKEEDFRKCIMLGSGECVENYEASPGEDLNITLSLTNSGTGASVVDMNNRREIAGSSVVWKEIGDTHFEGIINAGETRSISYTIRVEKGIAMNLPPASATYRNAFGEEESLFSNQVLINPKAAPEVGAFIGVGEVDQRSRQASISLTVFNPEPVEVSGINARLELGAGLEPLEGSMEMEVPLLEPKQSKTYTLVLAAQGQGSFEIGCSYSAEGREEKQCNVVKFSFRGENPYLYIGATIVLLAIGAAIYLFIYTREEYGE